MGKTIDEFMKSLPEDRQEKINQEAKRLINKETRRGNLLGGQNIKRLCRIIAELFRKKVNDFYFDVKINDEDFIINYPEVSFDECNNCDLIERVISISFDDIKKEYVADLNKELDDYWKSKSE